MEESSLQPWHLFTFFFLAFQAVVIYLRHILLTTIAAVAFGAITEVTSRYLQLAHLSPPASFPATSLSCSGVGGSGSPLSWLSSPTALGYFQSNLDIKNSSKSCNVLANGSKTYNQFSSIWRHLPSWGISKFSFSHLFMIQVSLCLGPIRWKGQLDYNRGTEVC